MKKRALIYIFNALLVSFVVLLLPKYVKVVNLMENWVSDMRTSLLQKKEPQNQDIIIVTITEETLEQFPYRSPLDRGFLADILLFLNEAKVKVVGIDFLFDQPTEKKKDERLKKLFGELKYPVITAFAEKKTGLTDKQIKYLLEFNKDTIPAYTNLIKDDDDGTVRGIYYGRKYEGEFIDGFTNAIAQASGKFKGGEHRSFLYHGSPDSLTEPFKKYQAQSLKFIPKDWFKDKIVLIGGDLHMIDRHRTPLAAYLGNKEGTIPGVEIHAHILAHLLKNEPLWELGIVSKFILLFLLAFIGIFIPNQRINSKVRIPLALLVIILIWWLGFYLPTIKGPFIPIFCSTLSFLIAIFAGVIIMARKERAAKKFIREAFSLYLAPSVIKLLEKDPSRLSLGGERKLVTVLFTDIAGFTSMTESMDPQALQPLLNEYLTHMSDIILSYEGTIDKYIGDAIVACFNAPLDQKDHISRAVKCTMELKKYSKEFSDKKKREGIDFGITRIGLHTGNVVVGNFGSSRRFDYTSIGDTVNTAARLESLNKHLGTMLCVSETSKVDIKGVSYRPIAEVVLKGKTVALPIFEPVYNDDLSFLQDYNKAYELLDSKPEEAKKIFMELETKHNDPLSSLHVKRLNSGDVGVTIKMEEK